LHLNIDLFSTKIDHRVITKSLLPPVPLPLRLEPGKLLLVLLEPLQGWP